MIVYCDVCKTNTIHVSGPAHGSVIVAHRPQCKTCQTPPADGNCKVFDYYLRTYPMPDVRDQVRLHIGNRVLRANVFDVRKATPGEIAMRDRYWESRGGA